jgi:hypothetical protein
MKGKAPPFGTPAIFRYHALARLFRALDFAGRRRARCELHSAMVEADIANRASSIQAL